MIYYLVVTQKGCGCDYMIGCGMKYERIDADDLEEAISIAAEDCSCESYLDGEREASQMLLLRVVDEIDLAAKLRHPDMDPEEAEQLDRLKDCVKELKLQLSIKTRALDSLEGKLEEMFGVRDLAMGSTVLDNLVTKAVHDEARKLVKEKMQAKRDMAKQALKEGAMTTNGGLNPNSPLVRALNQIASGV
jgi:hypothetical protein